MREGADIQSLAEGGFDVRAEGRTSRIHCRPFTNFRMDCWQEDSEHGQLGISLTFRLLWTGLKLGHLQGPRMLYALLIGIV